MKRKPLEATRKHDSRIFVRQLGEKEWKATTVVKLSVISEAPDVAVYILHRIAAHAEAEAQAWAEEFQRQLAKFEEKQGELPLKDVDEERGG